MHRPSLPPGSSWYSFLEAESTPGQMVLSVATEKIPSKTTGDRFRDPVTGSALTTMLPQAMNQEGSTDKIRMILSPQFHCESPRPDINTVLILCAKNYLDCLFNTSFSRMVLLRIFTLHFKSIYSTSYTPSIMFQVPLY